MPVYETDAWRDGRWGEPLEVTVVWADRGEDLQAATAKFLRCRKEDLRGILQELREKDLLLVPEARTKRSKVTGEKIGRDPRLTKRVRVEMANGKVWHARCYAFRGSWDGFWRHYRAEPSRPRKGRKGVTDAPRQGRFIGNEIRW